MTPLTRRIRRAIAGRLEPVAGTYGGAGMYSAGGTYYGGVMITKPPIAVPAPGTQAKSAAGGLALAISIATAGTGGGRGTSYGPYYKLVSAQVVGQVLASGEIHGTYNRNSGGLSPDPSVDAYIGELPPGQTGVQFTTAAPPRVTIPNRRVQWRAGMPGVKTLPGGDWVSISVVVTKSNP